MAVEVSGKWWKKHKPLTLRKEPLTKAFAEYDVWIKKLRDNPTRENMAKVNGALRILSIAIDQTDALCNDKLHAKTKKNLVEMKTDVVRIRGQLATQLDIFSEFLKIFQKVRKRHVLLFNQLLKKPTVATVDHVNKDANEFLGVLQEARAGGGLSSHEIAMTQKYVASSLPVLADVKKLIASAPGSDPAKLDAKKQAALKGLLMDLKGNITKVGTAGGFMFDHKLLNFLD
jgi:hypothetical protein